MTWLIGWDADGQRTAINLDGVRRITVCDAHDEPWFAIERNDNEPAQSINCEGAFVSQDATLVLSLEMMRKAKP